MRPSSSASAISWQEPRPEVPALPGQAAGRLNEGANEPIPLTPKDTGVALLPMGTCKAGIASLRALGGTPLVPSNAPAIAPPSAEFPVLLAAMRHATFSRLARP